MEKLDNYSIEGYKFEENTQQREAQYIQLEKKQEEAFAEALTQLAKDHPDENLDPLVFDIEEESVLFETISLTT